MNASVRFCSRIRPNNYIGLNFAKIIDDQIAGRHFLLETPVESEMEFLLPGEPETRYFY